MHAWGGQVIIGLADYWIQYSAFLQLLESFKKKKTNFVCDAAICSHHSHNVIVYMSLVIAYQHYRHREASADWSSSSELADLCFKGKAADIAEIAINITTL